MPFPTAPKQFPASRWLTPAGARALVVLLLGVKIAITAWNCAMFDGESYDSHQHARRAARGGLGEKVPHYDAPTYYLPALAWRSLREDEWRRRARAAADLRASVDARAESRDGDRGGRANRDGRRAQPPERSPYLDFLRATNFVYVTAFYLLWIGIVLPHAVADPYKRALAALLILALPGYQKLAAMPHPDNLHLLLATVCTALWVRMPGVSRAPRADPPGPAPAANAGLALATGLAGLSRPFAAAAVATFATMNAAHFAYFAGAWGEDRRRTARRVAALTLGTLLVAGSWMGWRGLVSGTWGTTFREGYIEQFDPVGFDAVAHLTSFHLPALLQVPNRNIARLDTEHWSRGSYDAENRYANSLWTTLYSETWGDHWLYFSGPMGYDRKVLAKRVLFVVALPLLPLLLLRFARAAAGVVRATWQRGIAGLLDPRAALLLHVAAGFALFLAWHLGPALSPGKHSTIKFVYLAFLFAPAGTLCFAGRLAPGRFDRWVALLLLVFLAALPVSVYVPRGW